MNMRIERDGSEWVAIIPPHPDMPDDEDLGLPAATEEEARAEGRAYEAITASSLYKFDFNEAKGVYVVSVGKEGEKHEAPMLAEAYAKAQEAYTKRISDAPPPPDKPLDTPAIKPGRPKGSKTAKSNGEQPIPHVSAPPKQEVLPPQKDQITSGNQLHDAAHRARIDRLEAVLVVAAQMILKELKADK